MNTLIKILGLSPLLVIPYSELKVERPYSMSMSDYIVSSKIIPPSNSSSSSSIPPINEVTPYLKLENYLFKPLDINNPYNIKTTFYYSGPTLYKCQDRYSLYSPKFLNGTIPYYSCCNNTNITLYKGLSLDFSYSLNSELATYIDEGITVQVGLYSSEHGTNLINKKFTIYPKNSKTINALDYTKSPYINSNSIRIDGTSINESYSFNNYNGYVECDTYYKLNLEKISFSYIYPESFTYKSARLYIFDSNNLFPYLNKDQNGNPYIPLKVDKVGNISLAKTMYVLPNSLEMSENYVKNFVKTNYFYLPKNKKSELEGYEMMLEIIDSGVNDTSISCLFSFYSNKSFIGNCDDSDYCIVGGLRS